MASSNGTPSATVDKRNLKQQPIPVVPSSMKIVNADGTVTRSGKIMLEQLQQPGADPVSLEINGKANGLQSLLNLVAGNNVTLTDDGKGDITIAAASPNTSSGLGLIQEVPIGTMNGTNTSFTLSQIPTGVQLLFLNGVEQKPGLDYTITSQTITYTVPPKSGDWQLTLYDASVKANLLTEEVPAGTINGTNAVFTLTQPPPGVLLLFLNGVEQSNGTDYTIDLATITYTVPPIVGDWHNAVFGVAGGGGTEAPGADQDIVYNSLGKFAGDSGLKYDYTNHNVILTGPPETGFIAPVFNSSSTGTDIAVTQKDQTFHITGSGDAFFQSVQATNNFNSLADTAAVPATAAAFQTSKGDFVVYGSGDITGQTISLTTPTNGQVCYMVSNPNPATQGYKVSGNSNFYYISTGVNAGVAAQCFNSENSVSGTPAFIANQGAAEIYADGHATFQSVQATTTFNSLADTITANNPDPSKMQAFCTSQGDFVVYGTGDMQAQTLRLTTPSAGQICFMVADSLSPAHGYLVSGDPNFTYSTVGGRTGMTAPFFNSTADTSASPGTTAAFQTSHGDFVVYGSGDVTAQTLSLTTPASPQICYMQVNPIAGRGNIISGNSGFIYATTGGYPGVIAPLFNASNSAVGSPCFIAGGGAAEIYGDGTATFNTVAVNSPTNTQVCYMAGKVISGSVNFVYSGNTLTVTAGAGQGVRTYAFASTASGAATAFQLDNQAFIVDGNGNVNCNQSIPNLVALKNQGAQPGAGAGFGWFYASTSGIYFSVNGGAWQVLGGAAVTAIYAGNGININTPTGAVTVSLIIPGSGNQLVYSTGTSLATNANLYWGGDGNLYVEGGANNGIISHVFNSQATGTGSALVVNNQIIVNGQGDVSAHGTLYALGNLSISAATSSSGTANFNGWIQSGQYFLCQGHQGINGSFIATGGNGQPNVTFYLTGGLITGASA